MKISILVRECVLWHWQGQLWRWNGRLYEAKEAEEIEGRSVSPKLRDGFCVLHVRLGPQARPAGVPPPPVQTPRGTPHLRGGSRPLAGQTHPNNAQGLEWASSTLTRRVSGSAWGQSVRTGEARRKSGNNCEDDSRTGINCQRCGKLSTRPLEATWSADQGDRLVATACALLPPAGWLRASRAARLRLLCTDWRWLGFAAVSNAPQAGRRRVHGGRLVQNAWRTERPSPCAKRGTWTSWHAMPRRQKASYSPAFVEMAHERTIWAN